MSKTKPLDRDAAIRAQAIDRLRESIKVAKARLADDSDLWVCATADGRVLGRWGDSPVQLIETRGSLVGAYCFRFRHEAQAEADLWNPNNAEQVEATNLNAALRTAIGLHTEKITALSA